MPNYSLKDAFKTLEEIEDKVIETSIIINGPLTLNESLENNLKEDLDEANIRVFDIDWETDDELVDLPSEMYLTLTEEELNAPKWELEELIANKLSDETGWLVNYFDYEKVQPKEEVNESKESLKEENFSLSDEEGLKEIEEFKKESENEKEEPELTIVDTNADEIDEVASNEDAAGSFVFTCDKCGENIFRTLDDLKTHGYERIDDTLFKLKNDDINQGEFYHCTKCGNDTFTGNKQIVLADVDAEVEGKPAEEENSIEEVTPEETPDTLPDSFTEEDIVVEELSKEGEIGEIVDDRTPEEKKRFRWVHVKKDKNGKVVADKVFERTTESLDKKELTEAAEITDDDIVVDYLSDRVAKVLDDYGILYGDIVEYPEHKKCNVVGVSEEEWDEAEEAIKSELGLRVIVPAEDHEEFDDELEVFEESLLEALSADKLLQFREHDFFKDFNDSAIRKFISLYLDFSGETDKEVTPEKVYEFMTDEGLGLFALDNFDALKFITFKRVAQKDPKFIEACIKYFPDANEDNDPDKVLEWVFREAKPEEIPNMLQEIKKIYLELDECKDNNDHNDDLKEGFKKIEAGKTFWSKDGEEWEECTQEEFDECDYEDVTEEPLDESMSDKVERTTKKFSKEHGQIICNHGEQEEEVVKLLKDNGYTVDVTPAKHGNVYIKYDKVIEEELADEFDEVSIKEIEEESLDKAISQKLSEMYENFASYKTEAAFLRDKQNKIILEGNLRFTTDKEQHVKFILEAIESDNNNIKFKLTCEDFKDIEAELDTVLNENLLEASSAEKKAYKDGGEAYNDLIQGKAIARIKDPDMRDAAVTLAKEGNKKALDRFTGDRKELQARKAFEKKQAKMADAGLKESNQEWKDPEDCFTLEEYDDFGLSDLEYSIMHNDILSPEKVEESDERDWDQDADGYVAHVCSIAAWGGPTPNEAEKRLLVDYIARKYPSKLKVLRRYFGNDMSSVDLDPDFVTENKEEK